MCTQQYQPVCGTEMGIYKTYGNGCILAAEGAVYQHEGECTANELSGKAEAGVTYTPPAHCIAWNDGCNSCSRVANGQAACTMMACTGEPRAGYCTMYAETQTPEPNPGTPVSGNAEGVGTIGPDTIKTVVDAFTTLGATATAIETGDIGFFLSLWNAISSWFLGLF